MKNRRMVMRGNVGSHAYESIRAADSLERLVRRNFGNRRGVRTHKSHKVVNGFLFYRKYN